MCTRTYPMVCLKCIYKDQNFYCVAIIIEITFAGTRISMPLTPTSFVGVGWQYRHGYRRQQDKFILDVHTLDAWYILPWVSSSLVPRGLFCI